MNLARARHQRVWFRALWVLGLGSLALCGRVIVDAHELGTTRVAVEFQPNGTYRIEISTDAVSLLDKLEASTGRSSSTRRDPADLQSWLQVLDDIFRRRFVAAFDGVGVRPAIAYGVTPSSNASSPPAAVIRLTGNIPKGARQFTWNYAWTFATYALTLRRASATDATAQWLDGGQTSQPISVPATAPARRIATAWQYLVLGFTHIIPKGTDHMLFVLGIFLLSRRARPVLWQVSAFTLAHSITLGLSIYGVISVAPAVVEPLIAVSIAYVAIENLVVTELGPRRVALVFAFGLLHGMGFAGALKEVGLPRSEFLTALVTFNLGVEAGQLAVIVAAFLLVGWYCGHRVWYRRRIVLPASALIACVAAYWTLQRIHF